MTTQSNPLKVYLNESWINNLSSPQIPSDSVAYFLNYWHLNKCHFFLPHVLIWKAFINVQFANVEFVPQVKKFENHWNKLTFLLVAYFYCNFFSCTFRQPTTFDIFCAIVWKRVRVMLRIIQNKKKANQILSVFHWLNAVNMCAQDIVYSVYQIECSYLNFAKFSRAHKHSHKDKNERIWMKMLSICSVLLSKSCDFFKEF